MCTGHTRVCSQKQVRAGRRERAESRRSAADRLHTSRKGDSLSKSASIRARGSSFPRSSCFIRAFCPPPARAADTVERRSATRSSICARFVLKSSLFLSAGSCRTPKRGSSPIADVANARACRACLATRKASIDNDAEAACCVSQSQLQEDGENRTDRRQNRQISGGFSQFCSWAVSVSKRCPLADNPPCARK